MKKLKKNFWKHLSTICLLLLFAILAVGTSSTKKGIKAYKEGDYDTALKELKGTTSNGSADCVDEFFYLGKVYTALGKEDEAIKAFSKAYNIMVERESNMNEFQKEYPAEYEELLSWGEEQIKIQEAEKSRQRFVGTYSFVTCNDGSSHYSTSKLYSRPTKVVFNDDGTGTIYFEMAKNVSFTWSADNGYLSTSTSGINMGINNDGYLVVQCAVTTNSMSIKWLNFFFKK